MRVNGDTNRLEFEGAWWRKLDRALTLAMKFLVPLITLILVPLAGWMIRIELGYRASSKALALGERVYSSTGEPMSTNVIFTEVDRRIQASQDEQEERLPPKQYVQRIDDKLEDISEELKANRQLLQELLRSR